MLLTLGLLVAEEKELGPAQLNTAAFEVVLDKLSVLPTQIGFGEAPIALIVGVV